MNNIAQLSQKKALIYCRVSSERQVNEGHGLDSQETICRDYAKRKSYQVEGVFKDEGISGSLFDRPAMIDLLNYLDKHAKERYTIIFDDISRFARDVMVHLQLKLALEKRGATIESPNFNFDKSPIGETMEVMYAAFAQFHRKENRRQVMQKMKARLEDGYWCFCPPPGLKNVQDPIRGKVLKPHEPLASIYKETIEKYANNELFTLDEVRNYIVKKYNELGLAKSLSINGARLILTELLYTGHMEYKPWEIEFKKGQHDGFISLETYNKVQEKLLGKTKSALRKDYSLDFPLRGFVLCDGCGRSMTASWNKGRNKRYPNYWCKTSWCIYHNKSINKVRIEADFETLLKGVKPPGEVFELAKEIFIEQWYKAKQNNSDQASRTNQELKEIDIQINNYLKRVTKTNSLELISLYENEVKKLIEKKKETHLKSTRKLFDDRDFGSAVNTVINILKEPVKTWKSDGMELKRNILNMYFEKRLSYKKGYGFGTADLTLPIKLMNESQGSKNNLVEMSGIEPESEKTPI